MERHSVVLWLMVLAVCVSTASAAVLTVGPGQTYSTVQAAVDAASDGDTIDDRLDSSPFTHDLDIVPNVLIAGMEPFPALGCVFWLGVGWPPHVRP